MDARLLLQEGCRQLNLDLSSLQLQQILDYVSLLMKWNNVHNLTAINSIDEIIIKHILDSLAVVPYISENRRNSLKNNEKFNKERQRLLDVGSGAGLPGIPLAIVLTEKQFVLLDSNIKKTSFLTWVIANLKITNVEVIHQRVENYQVENKFDIIIARAVSDIADLINKTKHLLLPSGELLIMKGKNPEQELRAIKFPTKTYKLIVPNLEAERHLVMVSSLDKRH